MPEVPKPLETVARSRMRTDSPHVSVWLDFEGVMERTFGMVPGGPNVVVIDTNGRTHSVQSGHLDELEFKELAAAVNQIRIQSRPDIRTASQPATIRR
jgi:predicted transcriptional regulator